MRVDELLPRLDGVRPRGPGRWTATCPAHEDREPSLSIRAGDRGVLVRCWANCTLDEICSALGLRPADLFYDRECDSQGRRAAAYRRAADRHRREEDARKRGRFIDTCKHAERFLESRRGLDISQWSDDRLDRELDLVAHAYHLLEHDPYGY